MINKIMLVWGILYLIFLLFYALSYEVHPIIFTIGICIMLFQIGFCLWRLNLDKKSCS